MADAGVLLGPRTAEQLTASLDGIDLVIDDAAMDRIDEIVPPGTDVYDAANWASLPWMADLQRRRSQVRRGYGL